MVEHCSEVSGAGVSKALVATQWGINMRKKKWKKQNEPSYRVRIASSGGIFLKVSDDWAPNFPNDEVYCSIHPRRLYICGMDDGEVVFIGSEDKIKELLVELLIEQPISLEFLKSKKFNHAWDGEEKWDWPYDMELQIN